MAGLLWFDKANELIGSPLWHQGAYIDDYLTYATRAKLKALIANTASQATSAWHATYGGNNHHADAIRLWRSIFGTRFPTYG